LERYMMTKIGNMQKIMIPLDIFAEEKSFLNWPENLPLKYQALVSGHPVYFPSSPRGQPASLTVLGELRQPLSSCLCSMTRCMRASLWYTTVFSPIPLYISASQVTWVVVRIFLYLERIARRLFRDYSWFPAEI